MDLNLTYETTFVRRRFSAKSKVDGQHRSTMPEYRIWTGMIARCSNKKAKSYRYYGGRGISVCDRWREDFENFYRDVGQRPSVRHSLDRINNDGNYEPGNVHWATPREQVLNRRNSGGSWTDAEVATLTRMYCEYYTVDEIAVALDRTPSTIRLRVFKHNLTRKGYISRLVAQNIDLRPILVAQGQDAFARAVTARRQARLSRVAADREASKKRVAEAAEQIMLTTVDRGEKIKLMRQRGMSLSEIGCHFGITRERVRQIEAAGFPSGDITASGGKRKISSTKPGSRRKHIDRLSRAWNSASREARLIFMRACPNFLFEDISAEIDAPTPSEERTAPEAA